jgi:hypothetical protein
MEGYGWNTSFAIILHSKELLHLRLGTFEDEAIGKHGCSSWAANKSKLF